ncbi:unnamed protein product [Caenorhabditis angaria]|uniref:Uncharacterized protein n=1 Tax=Caenorhabditis angaria TaxID=860376 RepID=A0A9P1IZL6_9PELO|nr:unnamed protein product [Caenorhabditis angaria]
MFFPVLKLVRWIKKKNLIEIKLLKNGRDEYWLKNRALSVYLQVYLCNIHLFLFGYRSNELYQNDKVHQKTI